MAPDSAGVAWAPGLPNYDHRITLCFVKTQGGMFKVPLWECIRLYVFYAFFNSIEKLAKHE